MNKLKEGQRIGVYEVLSSGVFFNIMKNDNFLGKKENGIVYLYDEKEPTMPYPMRFNEVRKVATLIVKKVK